jgi:hypothetical protein
MSNPFTFIKGSGKQNKASYKLGKALVPAAVITRVSKAVAGLPDHRQALVFYSKLQKEYSTFLDELDKAKIDYLDALKQMVELKPKKPAGTGQRITKVEKNAELFSKIICKRFKKDSTEEMVDAFLKSVNSPEFKKEAMDFINIYEKQHGRNTQGFIKTSNRKGNPAAQKALAKARAAKKK